MSDFAGENDVEMSLGEPEVEIEDTDGLIRKLENHIQASKLMNYEMEKVLKEIKANISKQDELNQRKAAIEADAGNYSEKLSQTAVELISNIEGTLTPDKFFRFFMNDAFGKPNPSVLPILRKFHTDVEGIKKQLEDFKKQLVSKHKDYMDERDKEKNLIKRIDRLVENIQNELKKESKGGKQTLIDDHFRIGE